MRFQSLPFMVAFVLVLAHSTARAASLVATAGDSIVATFANNLPEEKHGWGEKLSGCLDSVQAQTKNFAKGGFSARDYYKDERWSKVLNAEAKWVLIEFGHNDETDKIPPNEYGAYLQLMVDEVKTHGATPILITPPPRNHFKGVSVDQKLMPYVQEMKSVGAARGVAVVDLWSLWAARMEKLGEKNTQAYYIKTDHTHFNDQGATELAKLVCDGAAAKAPGFAPLVK